MKWPAKLVYNLLRILIMGYCLVLSPWKPAPSCRFYPTCSEYALEALRVHGVFKGSWLACVRIMRCHPWGKSGIDLVPPAEKSK